MSFNEMRGRHDFRGLGAMYKRGEEVRLALHDALAECHGAKVADAFAGEGVMGIGRFWFSLWTVQNWPYVRAQRFDA